MQMTLNIPDRVADKLPGDEAQRRRCLLLELACGMYAARTITHAQAAELAGLGRLEMQQELGLREIPIHYTLNDWEHDLKAGLCSE
jgi:predicted HTH domain antitoxin